MKCFHTVHGAPGVFAFCPECPLDEMKKEACEYRKRQIIDKIMKIQGINALQLSINSNVSYGTVLKALQGGNVNLQTWFKLLFALGYKIDPTISMLGE